MEDSINLLDNTIEEIGDLVKNLGVERFRAKQIFQWAHRGKNIDEMTNLSKTLREQLKEISHVGILSIDDKFVSSIDTTAKYLFKLRDGNIIESVLMKYKHGHTACISSQVGCRMGCAFCASTGVGFVRNLSPGEMLGQILSMQNDTGVRIGNVVIMGIGEPLDNYDNVIKFLRLVNDIEGLNIGFRHISLSTCGLVPGILRLAEENLPITLSISLHAPNDDIRSQIMPVAKKYSIDKIIEACKIYTKTTKRRITLEYALIEDVNDLDECAFQLAARLKGMLCHVNLIPVNQVEGTGFKKSTKHNVQRFKDILDKKGIETTVRRELGADISAACGQLRRSAIKDI